MTKKGNMTKKGIITEMGDDDREGGRWQRKGDNEKNMTEKR